MNIDINSTRLLLGLFAIPLLVGGFTRFDLTLSASAETAPEIQPIDPKPVSESVMQSQTETQPQKRPQPEPQKTAQAEPEKNSDTTAQPAGQVGDQTPDIFIPSENISEDLAVAFPVDI